MGADRAERRRRSIMRVAPARAAYAERPNRAERELRPGKRDRGRSFCHVWIIDSRILSSRFADAAVSPDSLNTVY